MCLHLYCYNVCPFYVKMDEIYRNIYHNNNSNTIMLYLAVTYMCFVYITLSTFQLRINGYQGLFHSWQGEYYQLYLS